MNSSWLYYLLIRTNDSISGFHQNNNNNKNQKSSTSLQSKCQFNLPNIARLFMVNFIEADPNVDKVFWARLLCQSCLQSLPWYTFMVQLRIMSHTFFLFYLPHIGSELCTKPSRMKETNQLRIYISLLYIFFWCALYNFFNNTLINYPTSILHCNWANIQQ